MEGEPAAAAAQPVSAKAPAVAPPPAAPMPPAYRPIAALLERVDEPYRSAFQRLLEEYRDLLRSARGSTHNHQAWRGGYLDHIREILNLAVVLFGTMSRLRPLPFSLSDALVVLFVHDLEKPWAYELQEGGWRRKAEFASKESAHAFRLEKLREVGCVLPEALESAVRFTEGEVGHYSSGARGMGPLAAFCHMCDVASARVWHDHPLEEGDAWPGARRTYVDDMRGG
jgi:hypothetical protein